MNSIGMEYQKMTQWCLPKVDHKCPCCNLVWELSIASIINLKKNWYAIKSTIFDSICSSFNNLHNIYRH